MLCTPGLPQSSSISHHFPSINSMIERSIAEGATYNLITNQYDKNVINSCLTDIEILKATTSIVSLIVTSNQYLTIKM